MTLLILLIICFYNNIYDLASTGTASEEISSSFSGTDALTPSSFINSGGRNKKSARRAIIITIAVNLAMFEFIANEEKVRIKKPAAKISVVTIKAFPTV
jgi:hypothetical protein